MIMPVPLCIMVSVRIKERLCKLLAGKSAALIMRHMNPSAIAAARVLFEEDTLLRIGCWSMRDAPDPSGTAEGIKFSQRDRQKNPPIGLAWNSNWSNPHRGAVFFG